MFGRSRRLRRYRQKLDTLPTLSDHSGVSPEALAELWRCIRPSDLLVMTGPERASLFLKVWYPNLPALTHALRLRNAMITKDQGGQAEKALRRTVQQGELVVQTLDFYLADDKQYTIDAVTYLNRLRTLLQEHVYALNQHHDEYYHRQSVDLYHDIHELTRRLITHY